MRLRVLALEFSDEELRFSVVDNKDVRLNCSEKCDMHEILQIDKMWSVGFTLHNVLLEWKIR